MYCMTHVVPIDVHSQVTLSLPILQTHVVRVENFEQVLSMFPTNIFYPEVVNTEHEGSRGSVMLPRLWCDGGFAIPLLIKPLFLELMCKDSCLWEAVHAFLNLDVHGTIVIGNGVEVVQMYKLWW